jgi:uncharacterized membrane protein (DUF373 family)
MDKNNFIKIILISNKFIIKYLVALLTVCLLLASINLFMLVYKRLTEPPFLVFEITILFEVFSLALIIAIGIELIKSLILLLISESIPSLSIIQIAIIAVANKIITLDVKHTDAITLLALAALMAGLGLAFYFHKHNQVTKPTN